MMNTTGYADTKTWTKRYYSKKHFSQNDQPFHHRQEQNGVSDTTTAERIDEPVQPQSAGYYSKGHFSLESRTFRHRQEPTVKTDKHQLVSQTTVKLLPRLSSKYKSVVKPPQNQQSGLLSDRYLTNRSRRHYLRGIDTEKSKTPFVLYVASVKSWPRVYRSQQLIKDLSDRCTNLEGLLFSSTYLEETTEFKSEIDIYLNQKLPDDPAGLLVRGSDITKKKKLNLQIIEEEDETVASSLSNFVGVLIDIDGVKLIRKVTESALSVAADDIEEDVKPPFENSERSRYLDSDTLKSKILSLLERVVFKRLHTKCTTLTAIREKRVPGNFKVRDAFETKLKEHKDTIDHLLCEMIALFKRSTIPVNERPVVKGFEKKQVSKQVETDLFKLDETIQGCGYRYSSFVINIVHSANEEERMEKIKVFLKDYGIDDIQFSFVTKSIREYNYVGAEIRQESGTLLGTLGAFAEFKKAGKTNPSALISKHVAKRLYNGKLYIKENECTQNVGDLIGDTLKGGIYDIAAANLHQNYKGKYDPRFKNSDNEPRPGVLYGGEFDIQSLPVHIFGAKTARGKGIVDIPKMNYKSSETYIQIKDRPPAADEPVQRMAEPGDSGAIICADTLDDDRVHMIAMLIGSIIEKEEEESKNPNAPRSYLALPLKEGIKQLEDLTSGQFVLELMPSDVTLYSRR